MASSALAEPLGGIVLAGGQSRRMGTPKAFLRLAPTGPTLIELVLAALDRVVASVTIVTNQPAAYTQLGRPLTSDQFIGLGALAGIHAGLSASPWPYSLVVACDMPFLSPPLLAALAERPRHYDILVPRRASGQLETLHAIYSRACLPAITAQLTAGRARISDLFASVTVDYVDEAELARFDPTLRSFDNLNTPVDLDAARQIDPAG